MDTLLHDYFGDLKKETLLIANIKSITTADCYELSLKIEEKTQKRISVTTLKRIYGFAATCYKPSIYTRNTLAKYCGYESYSSFLSDKETEGLETPEYKPWALVLENSHKVSRFRIESNKHKSGISYNFAIHRDQIDHIIEEFGKSDTTACLITAPAGGGKTVGLTKWIDRNINTRSPNNKKDIYLFIKTSQLLNASMYGYHGIHWLGYLIGLKKGEHLYQFINSYKNAAPGRFYLIIDDMSSNHLDENQYHFIFDELIEMVNYFSVFGWLKILLSVRSHIWHANRYLIEENENISKHWFTNTKPLAGFNKRELQELRTNLNLRKHTQLSFEYDQLSFIRLPLYFQLYHQLKKNHSEHSKPDAFDEFSVYRAYLNRYILTGIHFSEKKMLLDKLSNYVYYKNGTICIEQSKVIPISSQYQKAYEQLISSGIIHLYSETIGSRRKSEIRFKSIILGSYFLALRFLKMNQSLLGESLIHIVNKSHYHDIVKKELLKWLIVFSIESHNFTFLNYLDRADFIQSSEDEIVLFTLYTLNKSGEHITKEFNAKISTFNFVDFTLLHLPLISKHQSVFEDLLRYNLSSFHRALIHSALAIIALTCLKDDLMLFHINKLKAIDPSPFVDCYLNPSVQIQALYRYFKYGTVDKHALQEITSFNFRERHHSHKAVHPIILFCGLLVSNLSNSPMKTLRFLRATQKHRMHTKAKIVNEYNDFIQLIKAFEWIRNGYLEKATLFNAPIP